MGYWNRSTAVAPVYAAGAAASIRLLRQGLEKADGLKGASDASAVLLDVAEVLDDLLPVLRQVDSWLGCERAQGHLSVTWGS